MMKSVRPLLILSLVLIAVALSLPQALRADESFYQGRIINMMPPEIAPGQANEVRLRARNDGVSAFFAVEITSLPAGWTTNIVKSEPQIIAAGQARNFFFNITPPANETAVPRTIRFRLTTFVNDSPLLEKFLEERTFDIKAVAVPGPFNLTNPGQMQTGIQQPFTFSWTGATQAASYRLELFADKNGQPDEQQKLTIPDIQGTSFPFTEEDFPILQGGGELYHWRVFAINSQGETMNSGGMHVFRMFLMPPAQPFEILEPSEDDEAINNTRPTFRWSQSQNAQVYEILVYPDSDGGPGEPAVFTQLVESDINELTMPTDLLPGRYHLSVGAHNRSSSEDSTPKFRPFLISSIPGFNAIAPEVGATGVSDRPLFRWQFADNVFGFRVDLEEYTNNGLVALESVQVSAFEHELEWSGRRLNPGAQYRWRVVAFAGQQERPNNGGWRDFSVSPLGVFRTVLPVEEDDSVPLVPTFRWQDSANATGYRVDLTTEVGGIPNPDAVQSSSVIEDATQWVSAFGELEPARNYFFRVRALHEPSGAERASENAWVPFRTTGLVPFGLIAPDDGASGVSRTPTFQWDSVASAEKYRLHVFIPGLGYLTPIETEGNTPMLTLTEEQALSGVTTHYWTVEAISPSGESRMADETFSLFTVPKLTANHEDIVAGLLGKKVLSIAELSILGFGSNHILRSADLIPHQP